MVWEGHGFQRLPQKSVSRVLLGGAVVHRCDNCLVLDPALAAEATKIARERRFPQPLLAVPSIE
jgi:hypothetical protein